MTEKKDELKLIRMNDFEVQEIDWLWYQYIPSLYRNRQIVGV